MKTKTLSIDEISRPPHQSATTRPPSKALVAAGTGQVSRFEDSAHNIYHRNAMLGMAQAACWVVMAGFELERKKKEVGHGNWEAWVEANCEFNLRTAQRYIGVSSGVKDKAL